MSSHRDWATLEALKNSPKGRIQYNQQWTQEEEDMLSESFCMLSPYAGWVLENILPNKAAITSPECRELLQESAGLSSLSIPGFPELLSVSPVETDKEQETQIIIESSKDVEPFIRLPSSKMLAVESKIRLFEEAQKMNSREELNARLDYANRYNRSLAEKAAEQFKRFEEMLELKQRREKQELEEQLEKDSKEALERQEKLKEEHRHRAKLLTLKLREAEQQRHQELERSRQEEGRERMRRLCALQQEALQLMQRIEIDQKLQEMFRVDLSSYSKRGNQICGNLSNVVRSSSEGQFPSQDDVIFGERSVQELKVLLRDMGKEVSAAQERCRAEEEVAKQKQKDAEQQQQQAKAQASSLAQEKKQDRKQGLQRTADNSIMEQYKELLSRCDQCFNAISVLTTSKDSREKKTRAELQKAVFIPVSQISSEIGELNVQEVFKKLNTLLAGEEVRMRDYSVSVSRHALALEFVNYKLAERFVNQAEEEVASHHESAFPIAMVLSGIWERHPRVGELFLAHLYKKCPYAVPYYPVLEEGVTLVDYQRKLGYIVDGSVVERQDNFLKRMSGMIRLYAAILQIRYPFGTVKKHHPHGLNYGWRWLAQMLNMKPVADITATLLYDFLEVCGNALMKQYQGQFWKLISLLQEELFPRIKRVTEEGQMGSVVRLRLFLEKILQKRAIPLPKGYQHFSS
ncbi:PREDICTED: nucleoporin GLE1 [Nanorana parkeri]|uniref:nucleoporin GLE1 n=1 Tax=Nanorana parkeri TaxID=125878 RepID=UPI000854FC70|nr:PREDICTED: nucleoporin GLE1 [Nanorana parkeri]